MRFILVSDRLLDDKYFTRYARYAAREDIKEVNYNNAQVEIEIILLQRNEHFDAIILDIDERIDFQLQDNFLNWIRLMPGTAVYSNKNFKFNYIPVIICYRPYMANRNGDIALSKFAYNIQYEKDEVISLYNSGMAKSLDHWLNDLGSDLDMLDLDLNFNFKNTNQVLNNERVPDCKILSHTFLQVNRNLEYNWIGNKLGMIETGSEVLYNAVKKYEVNSKYKNEKEIHEIFNSHKGFLLGEKFKRSIYEKHLYYQNSKRYIEVDFINIGYNHYNAPIELFEVKLPNHRFYSKKGILYNYSKKYFDQIGKRYKSYFDDLNNYQQIIEKLNVNYSAFSLTLLMGRQEYIEDSKQLLQDTLSSYGQNIKLISFDDLISKYEQLFKRISRFSLN